MLPQFKRDFIDAASEAVNKELRSGKWSYYHDYTLEQVVDCDPDQTPGAVYGERFIYAPRDEEDPEMPRMTFAKGNLPDAKEIARRQEEIEWRKETLYRNERKTHYPLHLDTLFLEFARLVEEVEMDTPGLKLRSDGLEHRVTFIDELDTERNAEAALEWARRYGVLGLTPRKGAGRWGGDARGGEEDTLKRFVYEAWTANVVLRLYETATSGEPDLEFIQNHTGVRTLARAVESALHKVNEQAQLRLERYCYPQLYDLGGGARQGVGYGFTSLLGAMWLQMTWLLTATGGGRHCEWCNNTIAIEYPEPTWDKAEKTPRKKRKTYTNKRFCDANCKQKAYYHRLRLKVDPRPSTPQMTTV